MRARDPRARSEAGNHCSQASTAADRVAQFVQAGTLGQVAGGAVVERASDHARVVVGRNHDHRHARVLRADRRQSRQPMVAGHVQVEQDQVDLRLGFQCGEHASRIRPRAPGLSHRFRRGPAQRGAEQRVVVGDQQGRHRASLQRARPRGGAALVRKYDEGAADGLLGSGMNLTRPHYLRRAAVAFRARRLRQRPARATQGVRAVFTAQRVTRTPRRRRPADRGLGLDGLRAVAPPAFADPAQPTPAELRRRAIWSNWRGIADLAPGGGYGELYGSIAAVPGREFSAFATDRRSSRIACWCRCRTPSTPRKRCVVVTASSGSRGIYGSIAVAGAWGLPKGCAVAYTDKGAAPITSTSTRARACAPTARGVRDEELAFEPDAPRRRRGVAFKHAHSTDNPEADWGRHVKQAAEFALAGARRRLSRRRRRSPSPTPG